MNNMSRGTSNSTHPICTHNILLYSFGILHLDSWWSVHLDVEARNLTIILDSSVRSAYISNESLLTINSTPKMSFNLLIPPTTILIFSLLDYCHSFLMGLPVSRVTTELLPECAFWITNLILSLTQLKSSSGSQTLTAWKFKLLRIACKDSFWCDSCLSSATQDGTPHALASHNALPVFTCSSHAWNCCSLFHPSYVTCSGQLILHPSVHILSNNLMHVFTVVFTSLYFNSLFMY